MLRFVFLFVYCFVLSFCNRVNNSSQCFSKAALFIKRNRSNNTETHSRKSIIESLFLSNLPKITLTSEHNNNKQKTKGRRIHYYLMFQTSDSSNFPVN